MSNILKITTIMEYGIDQFNSECEEYLLKGWVPLYQPQVHTETLKSPSSTDRYMKDRTIYVQQWALKESE